MKPEYRELITNISTPELLEAVINIAEQASSEILAIYETDFDVDNKEDRSPLTAADMAAHKLICRELNKLTPDVPVLSEESSGITYETRGTWGRYWLVDPLDGTREFIKRNGEFTVNIALIMENRPVMGVVYVPVRKICYSAAEGLGAGKRENSAITKINTRKTVTGRFAVAGSRSHGSERQNEFINRLGDNVEMFAIGSSLKLCLVAEGIVDIYPRFGPTSEWDTAAAQCVVEQAGGIVTDTFFRPLLYNTKESLLNPEFLVIADREFDWMPYLKDL